jgi:hypothetical protein
LSYAAIVLTSAPFVQDLRRGALSTEVTYTRYVQKYAKRVRKNVQSMQHIMRVVKNAPKHVKNALSYAPSFLKHSITLMVKGRLPPLTIKSYSSWCIFNVYLSAKFLI